MQHCINLGDIQLLRLHLGEDGESIKMQVYVKKGGGGGGPTYNIYQNICQKTKADCLNL